MAKAFALRDAPKAVSGVSNQKAGPKKERERKPKDKQTGTQEKSKAWEAAHDGEAEKRMKEIVRAQGRLTKKGGVMMSSGASEFQISGGAALERLVRR